MNIDSVIKGRRSIRNFKKKDVSWNKINEILESCIYAPCAGEIQNWRLIVLKNKGQLNDICFNQEAVIKSDFLVVVCSDDADLKRHYKDQWDLFSIQNTSSGIQNMLLKAASMKIGSCWIGVYKEEELKGLLRIPDEIDIHAILAFGYSNEKPEIPLRATLANVINYDFWGNKKKDSLPLIKK
jgi:nitroreductase